MYHCCFSRNNGDEFEFSTKGDVLTSSGSVVGFIRHDVLLSVEKSRIDGIDDSRHDFFFCFLDLLPTWFKHHLYVYMLASRSSSKGFVFENKGD